MLKFYYSAAPNPTKIALFLEEAGLPYEAIPVDTRKGDQHKPEYLAINPNAKVPAIVDGDAVVFDSSAILLYLAEKTGKFLPAKTDKARGELLSWMFFVSSGVGPYSGQSVHFRVYAPEKLPYAINRYAYEAQRHFGILDARLAKQKYMLGDTYTIVDMNVWGWARLIPNVLGEGGWAKFPNLKRLVDEISARPAAQKASDAEGPAPVQDRDGRCRQEGDVRASQRKGCLTRQPAGVLALPAPLSIMEAPLWRGFCFWRGDDPGGSVVSRRRPSRRSSAKKRARSSTSRTSPSNHGEDVVNGTLTLDGVRRILQDGEEIPELAMAGDDGEILELEELPGPVIRMFVIWTKYETQDEAQNLYLIECKGMRWEAEE